MNLGGWEVWQKPGADHVVPIDDLKPHDLTAQCHCKPRVEDYEGEKAVIIHNSFDGREAYEEGQRKVT